MRCLQMPLPWSLNFNSASLARISMFIAVHIPLVSVLRRLRLRRWWLGIRPLLASITVHPQLATTSSMPGCASERLYQLKGSLDLCEGVGPAQPLRVLLRYAEMLSFDGCQISLAVLATYGQLKKCDGVAPRAV
ncbi:hypothetical protein AK812_SmicGene30832 [Symbiodinium microadriaticum]|uniref:Uncharacterized protein n=1 Tax=Symbiodinium microadriaticum TaxID=2951 RepID=A0A1Q9CYC8_SYMMI|nr:hypothetical protein AK812_SmicGene30832 [Symbiodinium microadriaticum]